MMESEEKPKEIILNNNFTCPLIGIGTSHMKNEADVIYQSIRDGTRLIDTASKYQNEEEVGKGIKKAIEDDIVKREDLFVVTKCWITEKEDPEKALRNSLVRLQLDYVDLYLDHWPSGKCYGGREPFELVSMKDMWPKMENLVQQGLTRSIGVSNYNVQNLLIILSLCKIKPVVNEVEFHPYLYQEDLKEFCDKLDIKEPKKEEESSCCGSSNNKKEKKDKKDNKPKMRETLETIKSVGSKDNVSEISGTK